MYILSSWTLKEKYPFFLSSKECKLNKANVYLRSQWKTLQGVNALQNIHNLKFLPLRYFLFEFQITYFYVSRNVFFLYTFSCRTQITLSRTFVFESLEVYTQPEIIFLTKHYSTPIIKKMFSLSINTLYAQKVGGNSCWRNIFAVNFLRFI